MKNPESPQATGKDDDYIITYGDMQKFTLRQEDYSIATKLRAMDENKIDVSLLSLNIPGPEMLIPELGEQGAQASNDFLAEVLEKHPDRFMALASLPLQDVPAALKELDRTIDRLGFSGVIVYSHVGGKPLDSPELEPFYRRVEEKGMPIVLHPTVPTWGEEIKDYSMIPMVGFMVDTSFAMLRLILGGVLERYPHLQIVQPHVGGILPYLMGRVENQTEVMGRGRENITQAPSQYYNKVYLDIVSPSPLAIRYAYDFAGPDRLLFGSDHPWVSIDTFVKIIENMEIPDEDKAKIYGENARQLFKR